MNVSYRTALPLLREKIKFELEEITSLDLFYNDGDSRVSQSFFKLLVSREGYSVTVVYIAEGSFWVSFGNLSDEERSILDEWIKTVPSK